MFHEYKYKELRPGWSRTHSTKCYKALWRIDHSPQIGLRKLYWSYLLTVLLKKNIKSQCILDWDVCKWHSLLFDESAVPDYGIFYSQLCFGRILFLWLSNQSPAEGALAIQHSDWNFILMQEFLKLHVMLILCYRTFSSMFIPKQKWHQFNQGH